MGSKGKSRSLLAIIMAWIMIFNCMLVVTPANAEAAGKNKLKVSCAKTVFVGKTTRISTNMRATYKSSNKKIAVVTKKGVVQGKKPGNVKITVTAKENKKQKKVIKIKVKQQQKKQATTEATTEKASTEKTNTEKVITERVTTERVTTEKVTTEKITTEKPAEEGVTTEATTEFQMPSETGEKIYIYSWNSELQQGLFADFKSKYPQYADQVEYVNLDTGGTDPEYEATIDKELSKGVKSEKYPSIIVSDADISRHWIESDYTANLSGIGIDKNDTSQMYQYTLDYGTYNNKLKALTWQVMPGFVCYRTDIAKEVLGSSDRETVQAAMADWDKFFETAQKMQQAGYKIVSGNEDIKYALCGTKDSPWVQNGRLNTGSWVNQYLEYSKKLFDNNYTNNTEMWSDKWRDDMDGDVFCYFGTTWFLYWSLLPDYEDGTNDSVHAEDYNVVPGPQAFNWGGTYLTVGKDCPNKSLAALVLKTICCDKDVLKSYCEQNDDFVNNRLAVQELIKEGKGACKKCGGDNPLPVFLEAADRVSLKYATSYDAILNGYLYEASCGYNSGKYNSEDAAIQYIKGQVAQSFPSLIMD